MYVVWMHRTQIYLEELQVQALRSRARREGKTVAAVIREILDRHLGLIPDDGAADPLAKVIGIGAGDGAAVAEHCDEFLYGDQE